MTTNNEISKELRDLVSSAVKLLGNAVLDIYGKDLYQTIENLRIQMKSVRGQEPDVVYQALEKVYQKFKGNNQEELQRIAKAFSLMLELINSCEAAYRSHRLKDYKFGHGPTPHSLVFVFTSHPTEARSKNFLYLTDKVEMLLLKGLENGFDSIEDQLLHLMRMALKLNLANNRRPQVQDEAEQIFHTVLDESILMEQVNLKKKGLSVFFRTWVGGDKDGHPKVGHVTMLQSMNLSRAKILSFINKRLDEFTEEIIVIGGETKISRQLDHVKTSIRGIRKVGVGDGKKVKELKQRLTTLKKIANERHLLSPSLTDLDHLLWLYPAIVLPLEIREDHDFIHEALKKPSAPISRMLTTLKKISQGLDAKWYVRGFVISMCQSTADVIAAVKLTKKCCGSMVIPVVPLFENEKGLTSAIEILSDAFQSLPLKTEHHKKWGGRFEVMLGYSDSSKENGVLPGRLLVEKAMFNLEKFLTDEGFTPVFFHGSGGSVSRGGGSIKEQIAWLPQSALNIYKVTVQGETVQRHFHQPLIMRSQVAKIVDEFSNYKARKRYDSEEMNIFSKEVQNSYKALVSDSAFQNLTMKATPYDFLNLLKIGSRPTKRRGKGQFTVRAIPWILCWTQTRLLLPIWWGVGSSWKNRTDLEKEAIKEYYKNSPIMQSFIKNLGFTLAKMELGVWKFQVEHAKLSIEDKKLWYNRMSEEVNLSIDFFNDITGQSCFTWFNPRLGLSIFFRSSMIHPLNVIQKIAIENGNDILLRETVTGIACGMLTTG